MEVTRKEFEALSARMDDLEKEMADMRTSTIQWVISIAIATMLVVISIVSAYTGMLMFAGGLP